MAMADEPKATPTPEPTVDPFEAEWEALVAAAREEGKLDRLHLLRHSGRVPQHAATCLTLFQENFGIEIVNSPPAPPVQQCRSSAQAERAAGSVQISTYGRGASRTTNTRLRP